MAEQEAIEMIEKHLIKKSIEFAVAEFLGYHNANDFHQEVKKTTDMLFKRFLDGEGALQLEDKNYDKGNF